MYVSYFLTQHLQKWIALALAVSYIDLPPQSQHLQPIFLVELCEKVALTS